MTSLAYVEMKGRYAGDIEPASKLRHGKGTYTYANSFFQYQGDWKEGVKTGYGALVMRDGSYYQGEFVDGEMTGKGTRTWEDGSIYTGSFSQGEKTGYGEIQYGSRNTKEATYNGDWIGNIRHGYGEMTMRDMTVMKGEFINNYPEGHCNICYTDGSEYNGNVTRGEITGIGELKNPDGSCYKGSFVNGVKQGNGCYFIDPECGGTYQWQGTFANNEPELQANELNFELISPVMEEKEVENKKAPAKGQAEKPPTFTEEEECRFENRVLIKIGGAFAEEPQTLSFNLKCVFQGPEYEDTVPVEEVEQDKKGKKPSKDTQESTTRMVKPPPVLLQQERGRIFQFELGRDEVFLGEGHTQEEVDELKEQSQDVPEDTYVNKWIRYRFKQPVSEVETDLNEELKRAINDPQGCSEEEMLYSVTEENGTFTVDNIKFLLDPKFKAGSYTIKGREVTLGLPEEQKMANFFMLLKIVDLDEEAAKLEAEKNVPKGKKR